jgi:hypothetical protein
MSFLASRLSDPRIVALLGQTIRPGVAYLQRYLELVYFPVGTPGNALIECYFIRWQQIMWCLTLLPRRRVSPGLLDAAIATAGLRARKGAPAVHSDPQPPLTEGTIPSPDQDWFAAGFVEMDLPMQNVIYLENVPGHLVYRDPRAAIEEQHRMIEALEREHLGRTSP